MLPLDVTFIAPCHVGGIKGIKKAVSTVVKQMKVKGVIPTHAEALSDLGSRAKKGAIRSVTKQMKEKMGVIPTHAEALSKLGSRAYQGRIDAIVSTGIPREEAASELSRMA
jgi:hypothetical protein